MTIVLFKHRFEIDWRHFHVYHSKAWDGNEEGWVALDSPEGKRSLILDDEIGIEVTDLASERLADSTDVTNPPSSPPEKNKL